MKKIAHLLILSILILGACKSSQNKRKSANIPDDFALELRHVGCRGSCPDYRINVDAKGNATWYGHHAVDMMGNYHKSIDIKNVEAMVKAIETTNFWEFEEVYGGGVADLPSIVTKVTMNGKTKSVEDIRYAPQALKDLEAKLESLVGKDGWIKDEK